MPHHIIYKQQATIRVDNEEQAYAVQNMIGDVLKNELSQQLETVFDELTPDGEIIRIDSLQLDLGTLPMHNIKQAFAEQLITEIRKAIVEKKEKRGSEKGTAIIQQKQSLREAFLHFLQSGTKPWFASTKKASEWETEMQQGFAERDWQKTIAWLRSNYQQQPVVIERLVSQFSDDFLDKIVAATTPFIAGEWKAVYDDLLIVFAKPEARNKMALRNEIRMKVLASFLLYSHQEEALYSIVKEAVTSWDNNENSFFKLTEISAGKFQTSWVKEAVQRVTDEIKKEEHKNELTGDEGDINDAKQSESRLQNQADNTPEIVVDKEEANSINTDAGTSLTSPGDDNSKPTVMTGSETEKANDVAAPIRKKPGDSFVQANDVIGKTPQYVVNSGIILLHPFLEMYFGESFLLQERRFVSDDACKRAVLLLHYLTTGETEGAEYDMLLQKILCGLAVEETLPNKLELLEKEQEEAMNLLQSVINYWPPLKNTSADGLRSTFLQREGKLEAKENGWLLTVEQKTVDVLLDKLPWGFSTIKLPWMKEMLNVDWC